MQCKYIKVLVKQYMTMKKSCICNSSIYSVITGSNGHGKDWVIPQWAIGVAT